MNIEEIEEDEKLISYLKPKEVNRFKRHCGRCNKLFKPNGKHQKYCITCNHSRSNDYFRKEELKREMRKAKVKIINKQNK